MGRRAGDGRAGAVRVEEDDARRPVRRRIILATGAWSALAWAASAFSQSKQPVLVGWLHIGSRSASVDRVAAFKEAMAALGWKEGVAYVLEERWAGADLKGLPALAEELKLKKAGVIVAAPDSAVLAVSRVAPQTPIVQANGNSPVDHGLAASLARPGGTVTGVINIVNDVSEKFPELLLAAAPRVKRIGFLLDLNSERRAAYLEMVRRAATRHSIEASTAEVEKPEDLEPALTRLASEGAEALVVLPGTGWFDAHRRRLANLALARRWPVIAGSSIWVADGALISYGTDRLALYRRAAYYVDKILKGARPGDLPIEQPTKFELVVNLKTAKTLGLTIPQAFLMRADRVIE